MGVGVGEEEGVGPGRLVEWGQVGSLTVLAGHFPPPLHTHQMEANFQRPPSP